MIIFLRNCSNGLIWQNEEGKTFYSWRFEDMEKYQKGFGMRGVLDEIFDKIRELEDKGHKVIYKRMKSKIDDLL